VALRFPFFGFGKVQATASDRANASATKTLEHLDAPQDVFTLVAGGRQTKGALPVCTKRFDGAIYSSRGRGYARYNEDGAGLYADEEGFLYASVFDQAGGLGGTIRGAASEVAAHKAFRAFRKIATGTDEDKISDALVDDAIGGAHEALIAREEGEVTTAVLAVSRANTLHLVTSGDSAAFHFDAQARPLGQTIKHEVPTPYGVGALTHAVGLEPEGHHAERYRWAFEPGHWVIMASDGLLDAGLSVDDWGKVLSESDSAEQAVNTLASKVLRRMSLMQAKPDNLTIVAFRAL